MTSTKRRRIFMPTNGSRLQLSTGDSIWVLAQFVLILALGHRMGVLGVSIGYCASAIVRMVIHRNPGIWTYRSLNWNTFRDAEQMLAARSISKLAWREQ